MSAGEPVRLRPLGAGELLDRAVTVYVRAFVPLAVIALAFAVPDAIVEALHGKDLATVVSAILTAAIAKAVPGGAAAPVMFYDPLASLPWTLVRFAIDGALEPLRAAAVISVAIASHVAYDPPRSIAFIDSVAVMVGLVPLLGACFCCIVSSCICVCERSCARVAIRSTIERLSKRGERARRFTAFVTYGALVLGMLVAFVCLFAALHAAFGIALARDIVRSCAHPVVEVFSGLTSAYVVVVYVDMRVRDDAYDLQLAARALAAASA